ncbi:hypothetical protein ACTHGU_19480 [Chitinophagaceae bacterium MMS25-I14]
MTRIIFLFIGLIAFESCDPGYAVFLINRSNTSKTIKVINVSKFDMPYQNSIETADVSDSNFSSEKVRKDTIPILAKDTSMQKGSYTFQLEKGKRALFQTGMGWPSPKQKLIVDNKDTIPFSRKDKRVKLKKGYMHYTMKITLDQ